MTAQRPRFSPQPCYGQDDSAASISAEHLLMQDEADAWVPLIHCAADFPQELVRTTAFFFLSCICSPFFCQRNNTSVDDLLTSYEFSFLLLQFEVAISTLVHHPEYNSTLILRSETVSESETDIPLAVPKLKGFTPVRTIRRKLLPRRPGRDGGLEQYCTLYAAAARTETEDVAMTLTVLVLTPIVEQGSNLPYYHPAVLHLAFRYIQLEEPRLQIEAVPLQDVATDVSSRLYRTALALLDTLHRYGHGAANQYKKRVLHDRIVPRDQYQDLYLVLRERHKHLVDSWQESTDPLKHVFEVGFFLYCDGVDVW